MVGVKGRSGVYERTDEHRRSNSLGRKKLIEQGWHPWNYKKKCPEISERMLGNTNGMKTWYKPTGKHLRRLWRTSEYKAWRRAVFERDNFTCQRCSKRGGCLEAHHIKPISKFPDLALSIDNGLTLCFDCHNKTKRGRAT